jgi:Predicted transcriptional regulators
VNNDHLRQLKAVFLDQIADNMISLGLSPTMGRVLGIIYLNKAPMTLAELSEATGMSKTRMSQVVRELLEPGLVNKVYEKGIRRDLYDVERDYYQIFITLVTEKWQHLVRNTRKQERKINQDLADLLNRETLSADERRMAEQFLNDSQHQLNFFNWIGTLLDFFESDEVFRYLPKK